MILDQLRNKENLSPNESTVADYLLKKIDVLHDISIQQIADETFTSPATVVRLAKKLKFEGWPTLRQAMISENHYLEDQTAINPNVPFSSQDSLHGIAHNLSSSQTHVINKTTELIDYEMLSNVLDILKKAKRIYIFAMANTAAIVHDFKFKMRFLLKEVIIINNRDDFGYTFQTLTKDDCCLFISYSGQSFYNMKVHDQIIQCICPTISITAYNENSLTKITNHHLYLAEMEEKEQNIGHFVSNTSIHYILDLIYACLFQQNYDESMSLRQSYINHTDK